MRNNTSFSQGISVYNHRAYFAGQQLTVDPAIPLSPDDRLNPFRQKYHPDHDGDAEGEVYEIVRQLTLTFDLAPPPLLRRG